MPDTDDTPLVQLARTISEDEVFQYACQRYHRDGGSSFAIAVAALRKLPGLTFGEGGETRIVMPSLPATIDDEPIDQLAADTIDVIARLHGLLSEPGRVTLLDERGDRRPLSLRLHHVETHALDAYLLHMDGHYQHAEDTLLDSAALAIRIVIEMRRCRAAGLNPETGK